MQFFEQFFPDTVDVWRPSESFIKGHTQITSCVDPLDLLSESVSSRV